MRLLVVAAVMISLIGFSLTFWLSRQPLEAAVKITTPFPGEAPQTDLRTHLFHGYRWAVRIGIVLSVFMVLWAGLKYMLSLGNPEALSDAKETLIGALAGLALLLLSWTLFQALGLNIAIRSPT